VIKGGDRIFLMRRNGTGFRDGDYSMIAGHVEDNETVFDAMVREAKEEAGLALDPKRLRMIHILHRQDIDREYVDFFLSCDIEEEPRNMEPEKCDDMGWFDMKNLPTNIVPYVKVAIDCIGKGEFYSEYLSK
jgi:8-oxo-dGTP pyrophosphatase MutT (NUDIX family)